jgi:hypothetical protein
MDILQLRNMVREGRYKIAFFHTEKLRQRRIEIGALEEVISAGEVIESYPHDPRGPSCLVAGKTREGRPLHIVCGDLEKERFLVITAYEPEPDEWELDWKTRKRLRT